MNKQFMIEAIEESKKTKFDVPVGCVIVKDGKIISRAYNEKEKNNDISAHAEIIAIKNAAKVLNNWRLEGCEMYVTLEPCPMCGWAVLQSRINKVFFGSYDFLYGSFGSKINLAQLCNSKITIIGGVMEEQCDKILKDFFNQVRNDK